MDDKIRQYVLKKEQQRKRARELREARKSESLLNNKYQSNNDMLNKQKRRVIGDPFETRKGSNFIDERSDPTNINSNNIHKRQWDSNTNFDDNNRNNINKNFKDINSFSDTWNSNNRYDRNDRYDRIDRVSFNKENIATQDELRQIRSMVNQLQGQMHNLQYQIDTLKYDNQRLKDKINYMEQKQLQNSINNGSNTQSLRYNQNSVQNSHSQSHSQSQSTHNSRDPSPPLQHISNDNIRNNISMNNRNNRNRNNRNNRNRNTRNFVNDNFNNNEPKSTAMDIDTPIRTSINQNRFNQNNGIKPNFEGFGNNSNNNRNNNSNNNNKNNNNNRNRFNNNRNRNNRQNNSHSNSISPDNTNNTKNDFEDNKFNGFNGFNKLNNNNNINNNNNNNSQSPEPMQMDDNNNSNNNSNNNINNDKWNPPRSSAQDLVKDLPPDAFEEVGLRIACNMCGRKFNEKALLKHSKICKKVFQKKRKTFDMTKHRLDNEAQQLQKQNNYNNRRNNNRRNDLKNKKKKANKWKSQSTFLREAIRAAKEVAIAQKQGKDISKIPVRTSQIPDSRTPCPYCGRKFSEEAANRHIPKCKNIKSRPKPLRRKR